MKNHSLTLAIITALGVAGCGSDSNNSQTEEPSNSAPETSADAAAAVAGETISIDVLANDSDPDDDELTLSAVGSADNGTAEILDGVVEYTANEGFQGDDSFTYTVSDGELTAEGTVTVTVNAAPTANADSAEVESGESVTIDVVANDTDPGDDELTVTELTAPANGSAEITDNQVVYTPNDSFLGEDSFSYTVSDGELTAEAEVTVAVVDTVTVVGLVTDEPIPNATVVINVDGQNFEVQADNEGRYELPVKLNSFDSESIIRIIARGSDEQDQGHVTLNSVLMSNADLIETAGEDGQLTRDEFNDVNVTHVTTARDALIRKAAEDEELTASNIQQFGNSIDPQQLIQMAAVVKLLVDNPEEYPLPEGSDSVDEFLANEEQYNTVLEQASTSNNGEPSDLDNAINETLEDPQVMPQLSIDDLAGRYLEIGNTAPFFLPQTQTLRQFNESGLTFYGVAEAPVTVPVSLNGNELLVDGGEAILSTSTNFALVSEDSFSSQEAFDAWIAYNGWSEFQQTQVEVTWTFGFAGMEVINDSNSELIIKETRTSEYSGFEFEYNGETYTIFPSTSTTNENNHRLVEVNSVKNSELEFDLSAENTWFMPHLQFLPGATLEGGIYTFNSDGTWTIAIYPEYTEALQGAMPEEFLSGTWSLSDDSRVLTLSSATDQYGAEIKRYRAEGEAQGVVVEFIENSEYTGMAQIRPAVAMDLDNLDFSILTDIAGEELVLTSVVNNRAPLFWDGNTLRPSSWFMYELNQDGTGYNHMDTLCDGDFLAFNEICTGTLEIAPESSNELTWSVTSVDGLDEALVLDRAPNNDSLENIRPWLPVSVSERDVVSVIEWNYYNYPQWEELYLLIQPRFNYYAIVDKPPIADSNTGNSFSQMQGMQRIKQPILNLNPLSGYKVVNPQGNTSPVPIQQ